MGEKCAGNHHHDTHSDDQTRTVLKLLMQHVWLDHSVSVMSTHLPWLTKEAQPQPWLSVEKLIRFVMPCGVPLYNMDAVFKCLVSGCRQEEDLDVRVWRQVCVKDLSLSKDDLD